MGGLTGSPFLPTLMFASLCEAPVVGLPRGEMHSFDKLSHDNARR